MSETSHDREREARLRLAASELRGATALLVTAGAGMGVDSGLPDFRGPEGFWNAYPAYRHLGLGFQDLANPAWFEDDPALAWGFYGHRLELYRRTQPHDGFGVLARWAEHLPDGGFVFTSNVDGHFGRSAFPEDRIVECHGSLEWLQCLRGCGTGLFPSAPHDVAVDPQTFRTTGRLPACGSCGGLARPNVLMFGDWAWDGTRTQAQEARLEAWLREAARRDGARIVVVECGAGTAVPTVRAFGERLMHALKARLIRINVREPQVPPGGIGISMGARDALQEIDRMSIDN